MSKKLWDALPGYVYSDTKSQIRKDYEKRLKQMGDQKYFKRELAEMMKKISKRISFDVKIADDEDKRVAFTEVLRHIYSKRYGNQKVVVKAYTLGKNYKWFSLNDKHNMESTIGHIFGEIDLAENVSDTNPYVARSFIPLSYELMFLNKKKGTNKKFTVLKEDPKSKKTYEETVEVDDDYRATPEGGFFPYINRSTVDLTQYQIFNSASNREFSPPMK